MNETSTYELHATTVGFGLAAAVAIICNTLLAWAKDKYPALVTAMKNLLGHHWTTHGVVTVLLFVVLGLIFSRVPLFVKMSGKALSIVIATATVLGGCGLVGWFLFA